MYSHTFRHKKVGLVNLKCASFLRLFVVYFIRLQPCLVTVGERFSKTFLAPHLHLTCIFRVPFSVRCTEPSSMVSFGGEMTLFCL
jgi:hypothetical protein